MRKYYRLLEVGEVTENGDEFFDVDTCTWRSGTIGSAIVSAATPLRRLVVENATPDTATEQKLAAIEARLRYVENELQANKDLRQDDLVAEKKWRNPVMPNDYGKQCQFSDDASFETIYTSAFRGYILGDDMPYIDGDGSCWCLARIEVAE
jgi:hypothetical protein